MHRVAQLAQPLDVAADRARRDGQAVGELGQLAWIVEKVKELTEPEDGLPEDSVDRDRILTGVSLYWFTGTAGSAAQMYYEETSANAWSGDDWSGDDPGSRAVPMGVLVSAHDVTIRRWAGCWPSSGRAPTGVASSCAGDRLACVGCAS